MKIILMIIFALASCSTLEKEDCSKLNWFDQGKIDGQKGRRITFYAQHALRCHQTPNRSEYLKGRKEGLKTFCTFDGGLLEGLNGYIYIGQCDGEKNYEKFQRGFRKGKDIYIQRENLIELKEKLADLKPSLSHPERNDDIKEEREYLQKEFTAEQAAYEKRIRRLYKLNFISEQFMNKLLSTN